MYKGVEQFLSLQREMIEEEQRVEVEEREKVIHESSATEL
jgi:hypothetical protein